MGKLRGSLGRLLVVALVVAGIAALGPEALAQEVTSVTLQASPRRVAFGHRVELSGSITPPSAGETVTIVDQDGDVRATATTDDQGHYRVKIAPRENASLRAQWLALVSDPVAVKVKPLLHDRLSDVRLFGKAIVRGRLQPAHRGKRVKVTLLRNGDRVTTRSLRLKKGQWFSGRFDIAKPGRYRVLARFDDADHLPAHRRSNAAAPRMPGLSTGSNSPYVKLLEKRLVGLNYHLTGIDNSYDVRTRDAVIAFNKVQGTARLGTVGEATWRALAKPRKPHARSRAGGFHIEIDQTRQLVYMVLNGKVTGILHTSTGANGYTHDGTYTVYRKIAGYSGGRLYYPSYFDGRRALHGWPEVPTYNASHGCARLPMWAALWVFGKADIGTRVLVYH